MQPARWAGAGHRHAERHASRGARGQGTTAPSLGANDQNISADIIAAIDRVTLDRPPGRSTPAPRFAVREPDVDNGGTWSVIRRTITSNQLQLAGNTLGWSAASGNSVGLMDVSSAVNGLIGSEITFTIDGVNYTRHASNR